MTNCDTKLISEAKLIRKKDSNELYNFFKNSKEIRNKIIEAKHKNF